MNQHQDEYQPPKSDIVGELNDAGSNRKWSGEDWTIALGVLPLWLFFGLMGIVFIAYKTVTGYLLFLIPISVTLMTIYYFSHRSKGVRIGLINTLKTLLFVIGLISLIGFGICAFVGLLGL